MCILNRVTSNTSRNHLAMLDPAWIQEIERNAPDSALRLLVGNKADLQDRRVISRERAEVHRYNIILYSGVDERGGSIYQILVYKLFLKHKFTVQN